MIGAPVVGRWFDELLHPDDREPARGIMAAVMTGRLDRDRSERRVLRADGTAFPATVAVIANTDFDRGMVGVIVQIEDISARKHAERKLAEAEERWKFALENSEQGVWDHDLAAGKTFLSPRWKALLGYAPHEIVDHPSAWVDLIHPEDRAAVIAADEAHRAGRTAMFDLEFRMRHRDGRWIWVRDRGKVVSRDAEGRALRMIGTHVDTTAERAAKAEQRRLDERIRLATDAAGIGLFEISEDAGIWWNERMHTLHGTDAGSLVPDLPRWIALVHPDDRRRLTRRAAQAFAGRGLLDAEYRIVRPDGTVRHIRAFAHRRTDEAPALVGTNWDVTAEREAVERLRRANSHIDQFATIASHDLQAPLRQIALWADLLHEDAAERLTDADREMIERIRRRARQTRRMVAGLLEFSRAGTGLALTTVDLSAMATEVVADFNRELAEIGGSAVVTPMPGAMADPLMVGQIFANLVSNAIKYRGERPLEIVFSGQSEPGFVVVTVRDNGIGIDPGDADAVFDLFTRLPAARGREGSGVGLAVCRRMADAMGGSIGVDTRVTGGSTFILKLRPVPPPNPGRSADAGRSTTA
jgi:PAS domain S-box-containing protein